MATPFVGLRLCCLTAALLALSLASGASAADGAQARLGDEGHRAGEAALIDGAHPEDRASMRQLLAVGGRNDPEVAAVLAKCRGQATRCKELAKYMQNCINVHGRGCLRCTYSTVSHVSARQSKCTAVRDTKRWELQGRNAVPAAGYELSKDGDSVPCKPGYAKRGRGAYPCSRCGAESYAPKARATSCQSCPKPKVTNAARTSCTSFGPGKQPGRNGKPQPCPPGTAKGGDGPFACKRCEGAKDGRQKFQGGSGASSCDLCVAGGRVNAARTTCTPPPSPPPAPPPSPPPPPPSPPPSPPPNPPAPVCVVDPGAYCGPPCPSDSCGPFGPCDATNNTCCFPGDAVVTVQRLLQGGESASMSARMNELMIGDMVLTRDARGAATYEPVYLFGHKDANTFADFVQIFVEGAEQPLEMTAGHFLPVAAPGAISGHDTRMSRAGAVRPGHRVLLPQSGPFAFRTVIKVATTHKAGLYNPFTLGGEIVVNGMLASCHSDWVLDPITPARFAHLLPAIYQALMAPARLVYRTVGPAAMRRLEARFDFAGPQASTGWGGYARTLGSVWLTVLAGKA